MSETLQATSAVATIPLDAAARRELDAALARLERGRGLIVRIADLMGGAVNLAGRFGLRQIGLSHGTQHKFAGIARAALARAYDIAILGLHRSAPRDVALTRAAVIASGAASGFTGLAGFLPDATFTTLAIMREVARIAASQGEDLPAAPVWRYSPSAVPPTTMNPSSAISPPACCSRAAPSPC